MPASSRRLSPCGLPRQHLLLRVGARVPCSSAQGPGSIVDVLALRADVMAQQATALRALVAGAFQARADRRPTAGAARALAAPRFLPAG